jgi:hypothetical protein
MVHPMTDTITHTAPELADVPACTVLAIDGAGAPAGPGFDAAVQALAPHAPIEGTWWSGDDGLTFDLEQPEGWRWTLAVPVSPALRLERRPAHRVAWLVHSGPYEDEGPALAALYAFVAEQGLEPAGPHTEIYLNDPSRTAPADLRTEIRVPVR